MWADRKEIYEFMQRVSVRDEIFLDWMEFGWLYGIFSDHRLYFLVRKTDILLRIGYNGILIKFYCKKRRPIRSINSKFFYKSNIIYLWVHINIRYIQVKVQIRKIQIDRIDLGKKEKKIKSKESKEGKEGKEGIKESQ